MVVAVAVSATAIAERSAGAAPPLPTPTICTVTINSSHEAAALREVFPRARVVELTAFGTAGQGDWLPGACQARVACDVLLVSGHFAGTFFGDSSYELPLRDLERHACSRTCDGVRSRPRLVFLFGCNTLAGKGLDGRTPSRYRQILIDDGLTPAVADRVVALRYGPVGDDTRTRMRRVFGEGALLLGFSSVGPVGAVAGPAFREFLSESTRAMAVALSGGTRSPAARRQLTANWRRAFGRTSPVSVVATEPAGATVCRFMDPDQPDGERLRCARQLLHDDPLRHALAVWDFLRQRQPSGSAEEKAALTAMGGDSRARRAILAALPRLRGAMETYFALLELGRTVGWIDAPTLASLRGDRLREMLRDGVSGAEHEFLCSQDLSYTPARDLLPRGQGNRRFIDALSCLAARSEAVRAFLLREVVGGRGDARLAALEALTSLDLLTPADVGMLSDLLDSPSPDLRASALWGLASADGGNVAVQGIVAAAVADPDGDVAWTSARVSERLGIDDAAARHVLAAGLSHPDGFARRGVARALKALAPSDRIAARQ